MKTRIYAAPAVKGQLKRDNLPLMKVADTTLYNQGDDRDITNAKEYNQYIYFVNNISQNK